MARPQGEWEEELVTQYVAYVDPAHGNDATALIGDPDKPFKRLQTAIDEVHDKVYAFPGGPATQNVQGLVIALPGAYGPAQTASELHNGLNASDDTFPIVLRDRVNVKGVGARQCVIRGIWRPAAGSTPAILGSTSIFAPTGDTALGHPSERPTVEVPVDASHVGNTLPYLVADRPEVFDGFSFQGGDVQLWLYTGPDQLHAPELVVSNCLFDMRNGYDAVVSNEGGAPASRTVHGPTFGVYMQQTFVVDPYDGTNGGYVDQHPLILNNTFILGQWAGPDHDDWIYRARDQAIAIVNATDPGCPVVVGQTARIPCDTRVYGLARCGIVNNLIRTPTTWGSSPTPSAFLGLDAEKTFARGTPIAGNTPFVAANAFAVDPSLAGSAVPNNGGGPQVDWSTGSAGFFSFPISDAALVLGSLLPNNIELLLPCAPSGAATVPGFAACNWGSWTPCPCTVTTQPPLPIAPGVRLYDGFGSPTPNNGICTDPGFVGEYLSTQIGGAFANYVDWRLLPTSPVRDMGIRPTGTPGARVIEISGGNGVSWVFEMFKLRDLDPFQWDGEHYGNPRTVNFSTTPTVLKRTDLGFDEIQWLTVAGSYGNESNSHNQPGGLHPDAATGTTTRYIFTPMSITTPAGTQTLTNGDTVNLFATSQTPAANFLPAWLQPPATLATPGNNSALPLGYQSKYIGFTTTPQWGLSFDFQANQIQGYAPLDGPTALLEFAAWLVVDNECSGTCTHDYWNTQAEWVRENSAILWSNLQAEFR